MGFFDFIGDVDGYRAGTHAGRRMNARHMMLIEPFAPEIDGARVYDVAAHDGRWSYAFAAAGAREVVGIEARQELVDRYQRFPDSPFKDRVKLRQGDLYDDMRAQVAAGETFDIVALFGIYYHVMDHFGLLLNAVALKPKLILIDSEFMEAGGAMIMLNREKTENPLNAAPQVEGQAKAVIGIPSRRAMEVMADVVGYDCSWLDWQQVPEDMQPGVLDYYREGRKRRGTAVLTPRDPA